MRTTRFGCWSSELTRRGVLDEAGIRAAAEDAETMAARLRERMNTEPPLDPMDLFAHVYAEQTGQLREQADLLRAEMDAAAGEGPGERR